MGLKQEVVRLKPSEMGPMVASGRCGQPHPRRLSLTWSQEAQPRLDSGLAPAWPRLGPGHNWAWGVGVTKRAPGLTQWGCCVRRGVDAALPPTPVCLWYRTTPPSSPARCRGASSWRRRRARPSRPPQATPAIHTPPHLNGGLSPQQHTAWLATNSCCSPPTHRMATQFLLKPMSGFCASGAFWTLQPTSLMVWL